MVSERSNKGKEKLIEDGDQNNLPSQQQNFGGDLRVVEEQQRVQSPTPPAHAASTELLPLNDFTNQITPRLRWTKKLHDHFIHTTWELGGPKQVTPKTLTKAMAIEGLLQYQVKSRLQAYREGRITDNWEPPRRPGCKSNNAGKIDGQKSASNGASTSNRGGGRNGPGMGDQNVGGNLETGTVTTPLNSVQHQQPHDSNLYNSLEQIQNHLELDERSRTVSAGHQQLSQVEVADISAANGGYFMTSNGYSFPGPYNIPTSSTAINYVQVGLQEQTPGFQAQWVLPAQFVGLQMQTPGFQKHNGFYYNFHQPGNEAHWFHPARYGVGLHMQTPGFQNHNGFYYNFHPGNENHWVQLAQNGVGLQVQTPGSQHQNGVYNFQPAKVGVGLQEQTLGFHHQNGVYNFQPAQVGVGLQEQTLGFHRQNGVYNFQPTQVAVGLPEQTPSFQHQNGVYNFPSGNELAHVVQSTQYGVGVQVQAPCLQDQSGFYNFQPGNELARMVQPTQYSVGIQEQTPGLQYQNGVYNFQPGNELACRVQPAHYSVGLQEQTPGLQYQHEVYNFQPGNELARLVQPAEDGVPSRLYNKNEVYNIQAGNETHMVQQPAQDGGALGNIQQLNQAQAATDIVQAQNGIYNFRSGNEAHRVQQPAHDGGALGNIQQQNQYICLEPQAATDTVQAQNATAIMPDNMVTTEDQLEDFLNLDSSELVIADFDFSEPFGFAWPPL